jgi:23S rRNA (adenine2503-C2)-methyltransferase
MVDLYGLPRDAMDTYLDEVGVGRRHTSRLFKALHADRQAVADVPHFGRHAATVVSTSAAPVVDVTGQEEASDGTTKLVLRLGDGALVEAVLVPMPGDRVTLCVSTQVGCAMACAFCATGTLGLARSLTAGEIVRQVYAADDVAGARGQSIRRLVFMGMGEPLHNYDGTLAAVRVLTDGGGRGFGTKNVTVSTVGLVDRMRRFGADTGGKVQLALSLHAGTDATRKKIIPAAKTTDLATLRAALLDHPLPGSRYLMLEYVVLPGVNDGDDDVAGVAAFTEGLSVIVNLIPFNPFPGAAFRSPTWEEVCSLSDRMQARGVAVSVRKPRGRDKAGACGQLALAHGASDGATPPMDSRGDASRSRQASPRQRVPTSKETSSEPASNAHGAWSPSSTVQGT